MDEVSASISKDIGSIVRPIDKKPAPLAGTKPTRGADIPPCQSYDSFQCVGIGAIGLSLLPMNGLARYARQPASEMFHFKQFLEGLSRCFRKSGAVARRFTAGGRMLSCQFKVFFTGRSIIAGEGVIGQELLDERDGVL